MQNIGDGAFYWCTGLTALDLGSGVQTIGQEAFYNCEGLTGTLAIPNSVTSIGRRAFAYCEGLTGKLVIPSSVTSIGVGAFKGIGSFDYISVDEDNIVYDSRGGCNAIMETATSTLISGFSNTIIPDGCVKIGDYAFAMCSGLTEITIPNSVISIGEEAFMYLYRVDGNYNSGVRDLYREFGIL